MGISMAEGPAMAADAAAGDRLAETISLVSHELRTPLTLINGYVATLLHLDDLTEAERHHYLRGIEQAGARLTALVDTLLDLSAIEAGRLSLQPSEAYLDRLARRVVRQAQAQTGEHILRVDAPRPLPPARCDGGRIEQVLVNLVNNAVKYSPAGGVIEVGLRLVGGWADLGRPWPGAGPMPDGPLLVVAVRDQGSGIAPEELPRLFEKFERGARPAHRAARGVGLGLYICRAIVEAHGGAIWAANRAGGGSCFTFCLPQSPVGSGQWSVTDEA